MPSTLPALFRAIALTCATVASATALAGPKQWEQLTQCRYVATKYNDGDSFRVDCGGREFVLRLYFIDTPESDLTNATRVGEQRAYFGVTIEDVLATGEKAALRVRNLLREPFSVSTRWAGAAGRSAEPRVYGLVDINGTRLIEVLVSEGLARTKGVVVNLPTGENSRTYLDKLRALERQARNQRRGIWANAKEQAQD